MNPDDLDAKTDAELNELFLREVAGWFPEPNNKSFWRTHWPRDNDNFKGYQGPEPSHFHNVMLPRPCTDANAVLPWLEKEKRWEINYFGDAQWKEKAYCAEVRGFRVLAPTFARAAVLALLRAKRASS